MTEREPDMIEVEEIIDKRLNPKKSILYLTKTLLSIKSFGLDLARKRLHGCQSRNFGFYLI